MSRTLYIQKKKNVFNCNHLTNENTFLDYDLRASINLMPLSIFKKLEIGKVQPHHMRLKFVDKSIAKLEGKIEDVMIKVDKFLFPADFIVLDYEAD